MAKPPLTLINPAVTGFQPPRKLGQAGQLLWDGVMAEYDIRDRGGLELLCLAAETIDRVQRLAERIDAEGEVVRTKPARGPIRLFGMSSQAVPSSPELWSG
jgi:hypothetical protein